MTWKSIWDSIRSDIVIRFKPIRPDWTNLGHLIRDFIITSMAILAYHLINLMPEVTNYIASFNLSLGINVAWEYKDGLHKDGADLVDFISGLIGSLLSIYIWIKLIGS